MSAEVWGVIGAFAGAWLALLALGVTAFLWVMSAIQSNGRENREEIRQLREDNKAENRQLREDNKAENRELRAELRAEIRAEGQERRADMQRFFDALYRHKHESDGTIFMPADD